MLNFTDFLYESTFKALEGESEVVHHLTPKKFDKFRPMSHFGTATAARTIGDTRGFDDSLSSQQHPEQVHHHAVRLKLGKVVEVSDTGDHDPETLAGELYDKGHLSGNEFDKLDKNRNLTHQHIATALRKKGINTIKYTNDYEDPGSTSYMITHPDQVRTLRRSKGDRAIVNYKRSSETPVGEPS